MSDEGARLLLHDYQIKVLKLTAQLAEKQARIKELEGALELYQDAKAECPECDQDYGEEFDEHHRDCAIGKLLKGAK